MFLMNYAVVKRGLDVAGALILLPLLLPLFVVLTLVAFLVHGRPIFFLQVRPGLNGRPFRLIKFRTMTPTQVDSKHASSPSTNTSLGRIFRKLSLDELPQVLNILLGEMSFVGPRPLLMDYVPHYSERQATRHRVRPGLTGLAQVSGRNEVAWEARLELDARYVESLSFSQDVRILVSTLWAVFLQQGIEIADSDKTQRFI